MNETRHRLAICRALEGLTAPGVTPIQFGYAVDLLMGSAGRPVIEQRPGSQELRTIYPETPKSILNRVKQAIERWEAEMNDEQIEKEIQAKGRTAPRVTPDDIVMNVASEHYFTAREGVLGAIRSDGVPASDYEQANAAPQALGLLTFCVLVLRNGFTVTGESACASPENFDAELGRKIAWQNAISKVWPLMGYALKEKLHAQSLADPASGEPEADE